jgi:GT2 family glycosyltransferase
MNRVSIHIVTKDRFSELALLLISLREQTYTDWDLVIVDGSMPNPITSSKFIIDIFNRLRIEGHGIQYIREDFPQGVTYARNMALEKDKWENPLILRVDDDSICDKNYLAKLVARIMAHPKAGAVGGIVPLFGHSEIYRNSEKIDMFSKIIVNDENVFIGDDLGYFYIPNVIRPAHHLRSSFLFRKEVIDKIGMFPIDYGKSGFREESDFCVRMLMSGYELWVDTSAVNWHLQANSGGVRSPDYAQNVQVANDHFIRKLKFWKRTGRLKI